MGLRGLGLVISLGVFTSPLSAHTNEGCKKALGLVSRLLASPQPTSRVFHPSAHIESSRKVFEGFTTGKKYSPDWRVEDGGLETKIVYGFVSGGEKYSVTLRIPHDGLNANEIFLDLPRTSEGEVIDSALLKAVLEEIYQHSEAGDRFELVINDPVTIEILNQVVADVAVKSGDLPYEPRRANVGSEDAIFMDLYPWNPYEDSFFPYVSEVEGRRHLHSINQNASTSRLLSDALLRTEFGKAIMTSGDWQGKIELRRNPRHQPKPVTDDVTQDTEAPVFPLQWRIILETQW